MNIRRISIILVHSWFHFTHSMETWVDLLWNPVLQILVFAFIGQSLAHSGARESAQNIVLGMIFWNVIWVGQYAIALGALWEIWSLSFNSLFVSPLTLEEFLVSQMISGVVKSALAIIVTIVFGFLVYQISVIELSWMFFVYFAELMLFSWAAGMFVLGLIFRLGRDVASFSWSLIFLVQPFGAVFFPVSILPPLIQRIAWGIPTSYIFEAMRYQIATSQVRTDYLVTATILNIVYLIAGYAVIKLFFLQAKQSGMLAKLEE